MSEQDGQPILNWRLILTRLLFHNLRAYQGIKRPGTMLVTYQERTVTASLFFPLVSGSRITHQPARSETNNQKVMHRWGAGNPDQASNGWIGRAFDLAGDDLSMTDTAAIFSRVVGRPVEFVRIPWRQFRMSTSQDLYVMYKWFQEVDYHVDFGSLRKEHPGLRTLEQALRAEGWTALTARRATQ